MVQASAQGWSRARPDRRAVIISRSGYPGLQQHAVVWQGDNHAWWEHLRLAIDQALQYALVGMYYTGADVPGFSGSPSADLAARFFQLGAFLPLFRGHSTYFGKDREPYAFPEPERGVIREAIRLRYSLLREWYSAFELAAREGIPPVLPVFDSCGRLVRDQFILFGKLLVAPVVQRDQSERLVYLPSGEWYRWQEPTSPLTGNRSIICDANNYQLPLFVMAGSVVVRNAVKLRARDTLSGEERFDIYPDAKGEARGYWYDDDGISLSGGAVTRMQLRYDAIKRELHREPMR